MRYNFGSHSPKAARTRTALRSASVGTQFKVQLQELMETINSATPHYVRCLKPNDENVPDSFNRVRVVDQLRYGGVLEVVKVTRAGYPVRMCHKRFIDRWVPQYLWL